MQEPVVTLKVKNHNGHHELNHIIQIFKPYMTPEASYTVISELDGDWCKAKILKDEHLMGQSIQKIEAVLHEDKNQLARQLLKKVLYTVLVEMTHEKMPWGILTGIRPTKIVHHYQNKAYTKSSILQLLIEDYCISREKAQLMMDIAKKEEQVLKKNKDNELSIYIGIPFCPTRCLYCSFTSFSLGEKGSQVEDYLAALTKEIKAVTSNIKDRPIRSVYIGGGTPTSLNEDQLRKLLDEVSKNIEMKNVEEYTVEAGRPDTITREKLRIMKEYGVDRISINPQTMNQKTLDIIGRGHTVRDIVDVFNMAREEGHNNINMDLIIGLPGESPKDVKLTMAKIKDLRPDNITVHTLAIKRASRLKKTMDDYDLTSSLDIEKMLAITAQGARDMDMEPYYMYRQKDMLGNFENIGYASLGKESIYNIQMIAEQQTIIAMGAGAVTKVIYDQGKHLKRIANVKNVETYISRIDEMISRKNKI